jgi:hypothetical protein
MPISWNEIRHNAIAFSKRWAGETREDAEAKSFWDEFFCVFGIARRTVASFEVPVKGLAGDFGYIDLLWRGVLIVEHKSFGKDLSRAESQAFRYIQDMARDPKQAKAIPRYIIVSDFARIVLHDLEPEEQRDLPLFDKKRGVTHEFPLAEFHNYIHLFAFIPGYQQHKFHEQDPINIEAVEIMGRLHDALESGGYTGHDLQRFLVRILFCLFAEDTGIFERESFRLFIENRTAPDGSDLGEKLGRLFGVLDTPPEKRQKNLDETLAAFQYINGELFKERLEFADFNSDMRNAILACTGMDWSRISPAIFGSLFQSVMQAKERRQIGAHYTSERDILKVIRSLFLDDLRAEFENRKADRSTGRAARLQEFQVKLCNLCFLDPACGCGNFLVIAYRELRQLELETLQELFGKQKEMTLDQINKLSQVDVDQFYGIEILEWPVRIAEVALWLMDHQMNRKVSDAFGQFYQRLPLKKSPTIVCGNALRLDWKTVLLPDKCSYVLGNPPFVGQTWQNVEQKSDQHLVLANIQSCGVLDYVCNWYVKASEYIQGTSVIVGFVSTKSITQGEQVGILWTELFGRYHIKIRFAHRTFPWESEARGMAHVYVVIIGFAASDSANKRIFDYESGELSVTPARNISPYLVEGSDFVVKNRSCPLCDVPKMLWGNKPTDGGYFLMSSDEKASLLSKEPKAAKWIRRFIGADEFLYNTERWCLWLLDIPPEELSSLPEVKRRVKGVHDFRAASKAASTRSSAATPTLFRQVAQPDSDYLAVPEVSSEKRHYIPMGFVSKEIICSNRLQFVPAANWYHFGILTSSIHMAWMRQVCGRLEGRYLYSNTIVYNNFPWPTPTSVQSQRVDEKAQTVVAARELHFPPLGTATLADLYDPLAMPPALSKAHAELDRAVEQCYRPEPFRSDRERVEFLFALYEKLTAPLLPATPKRRGASRSRAEAESKTP